MQFLEQSAVQISHGGSQGFKSPHLHPTYALVTGLAGHFRRVGVAPEPLPGQQTGSSNPERYGQPLIGWPGSPGFAALCSASIQSSQTFCLMMARGRTSGVDGSPNGLAPVSALARITDWCRGL
jgi:hypothetical protein